MISGGYNTHTAHAKKEGVSLTHPLIYLLLKQLLSSEQHYQSSDY